MKIDSREYKFIVDTGLMAHVAPGLKRLVEDVAKIGRQTGMVVRDDFDAENPKRRLIRFLETPDFDILANDLLLRQRMRPRDGRAEYTLKCRSEDRFIAATRDVRCRKKFDAEEKLEEDIGPRFVSKLSHSTTVEPGSKRAGDGFPRTLEAAARIFPGLLEVRHEGRVSSPKTPLQPVSDPPVLEELFRGPTLRTGKGEPVGPLALILWTRGRKVLTAELSFRHEEIRNRTVGEIAPVAKRFFEALQAQEWARPGATGKTGVMYGLR